MKKLYVSAWVLLAAAAFAAVVTGAMSAATLFVFSLAALGLVYALALWAVVVNAGNLKTE